MASMAFTVALTAAVANLLMAGLHFAISRAPGWRIARLFAGIALAAGLYSGLNTIYCIQGLPDAAYVAAGRLSYLIGTVQVVLWLVYAYADANGSVREAPRWVRRVALSAVATGLFCAAMGWICGAPVSPVSIPWAGITYYYPTTTILGNAYGLLLLAFPVPVIVRLARRYRRGERFLGLQVVLFATVYLFGLEEVLSASRFIQFPSLFDFGLLLLVMPFSWQLIDRVIDDARRLRNLSDQLESEVVRRTDERDQVRTALLESESAMGDLVANLDAILWEADAATLEVKFVSEGARRLLGYAERQWEGAASAWQRHLHPDDRERVLATMRGVAQANTKTWLEYRVLAADGRVHWFRDYVHPVGGANTAHRLRGVIVDVTESQHAHEALIESEERLRSLFDNATVGIYRTTPDGRILLANQALLTMLGYTSFEELAQRNLEDEGFEPGYARSTFRDLMDSQGVITGLEVTWTRRDGSALVVRESARAVRAPDGSVLCYDGIVEDFTERKRAEDALRESEERFRNIADTCPVIIWCGDTERQITFLNKQAATFTGRNIDELLGSKWVDYVHPDDLPLLNSALDTALSSGQSYQTELRLRRHDGEYRSMLDTAVPRFVGGVYAGHTGIVIDISDLKRAQEQAVATQKLESLGVLASGIAHDFNNLLGGILAQSELALLRIPPGSPGAEEVNAIKVTALQAAEMVGQLLAYAGNEGTGFEPVDLSRLVGEMLQLLGVSISKRATLRTELAEDLPLLKANAPQLRRVVMNLITNASEALPEDGGYITITTARVSREPDIESAPGNDPHGRDYVRLEVRDTGHGMSKELQARIFDPFFTTKFDGRGLGLSAVQGIVRSHGGTIEVTSVPGQGTCMEVLLPCAVEQTFSERVAAPDLISREKSGRGTILLVEDEGGLRIPIARMLRGKGFSVLEAEDGFAGTSLFRANKSEISVVLLDWSLPGMSGQEVFTELRAMQPGCNVILTSAYSEEVVAKQLGREKDWVFIRKPYRIADLVNLLKKVLRPAENASSHVQRAGTS